MNRDFKGVWIPREVWLNVDLSLIEKVFLVEIDSLDRGKGCFASNQYLADFFQLSRGRVSQIVSKLDENRYINIELKYSGKRVTKRIITINGKLLDITSPHLTQSHPALHQAMVEQSENDSKPVEKKSNAIPFYPEFAAHALSKIPNLDLTALRLKYDAWMENNWRNGYDKPIKNWKSALNNSLPYIKQNINAAPTNKDGVFKIPV